MKILVIGSGGREHALVWKLAQSPHAAQMWCAPGNAGIAEERLAGKIAGGMRKDRRGRFSKADRFCAGKKIDLTVVGPDNPLRIGDRRFIPKEWIEDLGAEPEGGAV